MCDGGCPAGCSKCGFQPKVCVKDLAKSAQPYLNLAIGAPNPAVAGVAAAPIDDPNNGTGHAAKFNNMAILGATHCVQFDPCCTSGVSFATAADLVAFLANDFTLLPAERGALAAAQTALAAALAANPQDPAAIAAAQADVAAAQTALAAALAAVQPFVNQQKFLKGLYTCGSSQCC